MRHCTVCVTDLCLRSCPIHQHSTSVLPLVGSRRPEGRGFGREVRDGRVGRRGQGRCRRSAGRPRSRGGRPGESPFAPASMGPLLSVGCDPPSPSNHLLGHGYVGITRIVRVILLVSWTVELMSGSDSNHRLERFNY